MSNKRVSQVLEIKALSDDLSIKKIDEALTSVGVYIQDIIVRPITTHEEENKQ